MRDPTDDNVTLSIVIPTRNDAEALGATLDHLDYVDRREHVEVIVAASGDRLSTEIAVAGRATNLWPAGSTRAALMNAGGGDRSRTGPAVSPRRFQAAGPCSD